jgi:hypothetical protein
MDKEEFQRLALARLDEWFGHITKTVLQTWFDVGIMYAVVKTFEHNKPHLYFFRVFSIGGMDARIEISQDKKVEI